MSDTNGKAGSGRGFLSLSKAKRHEIAQKGGKAAHAKGTAHKWDTAEAKLAGRKGGNSVSKKPGHMSEIGRRGGERYAKNESDRRKARLAQAADSIKPANSPADGKNSFNNGGGGGGGGF